MRQPSKKIIKDADNVEIINLISEKRIINEELYLVILADVYSIDGKGGVYRCLIYRSKSSKKDWSTCNCKGFFFTYMCKHLYRLEDRQHNIKSTNNDSV